MHYARDYVEFHGLAYQLKIGETIDDLDNGKFSHWSSVAGKGYFTYTSPEGPPWYDYGHYTYHADSAGYDALALISSLNWDVMWGIAIADVNGEMAQRQAPTAYDDLVQFTGQWDGSIGRGAFLANDDGGSLDLGIDVKVTSTGAYGQFFDHNGGGDVGLEFYDVSGPVGSYAFTYQVQNALGDWSNSATVIVEWFGGQSDRHQLAGTLTSDKLDFTASVLGIGYHGLAGDDVIRGSQGSDMLYGDDGADRIGGKDGNDIIEGGNGNDTLFGDAGNDTLDGGADNDTLWGGSGSDILRGGLGADQLFGDDGNDQLGGKAGNDALRGGAGNDNLWGDDGNDVLYGDAGNDSLNGGSGNDYLTGGIGADRLRGEAGVDTFIFIRGEAQGDVILDFQGAGVAGGDKIEFRGYGEGASVHYLSGDTWQIDGAGVSETVKIMGGANLSKGDFYFT